MGKNKLRKFAEMDTYECVLQFPFARLKAGETFDLKGAWNTRHFPTPAPIVVELGCGKGEYTVGQARCYPHKNYIGIDIKGARMHTGATDAHRSGMQNVAFLRTSIELLPYFFDTAEVSEIWITFPDPQMKKVRKRLTSTGFLDMYRRILAPDGTINLKTDSPFLYTYTRALLEASGITPQIDTDNLYASGLVDKYPHLNIHTHYENQWLDRGLTIKYLRFNIPADATLVEPDIDIPEDTYRSYSRGHLSGEKTLEPIQQ